MNIWFLTSGTLLAGITIGAVGFTAAERHFRPPETVGAGDMEVEVSKQRDPTQLGRTLEGAVEPRPQSESKDRAQRWRAMHEALLALGQRVTELEEQMAAVSANVTREAAVTAEQRRRPLAEWTSKPSSQPVLNPGLLQSTCADRIDWKWSAWNCVTGRAGKGGSTATGSWSNWVSSRLMSELCVRKSAMTPMTGFST